MNEDRNETGAQREQRIQGEQLAAEIARKREAGEPLTPEEEASVGVQADKDAQAALEAADEAEPEREMTPEEAAAVADQEEAARQAALNGGPGNPEGSSNGQTAPDGTDHPTGEGQAAQA